ncbi:MAG TPA: hypothetical protein PKM25_14205 [Candidatus Ozemobacteraceae bacterium]|nr:hypothetical protein [Candidatus Ozemobacteraceae bacterium]
MIHDQNPPGGARPATTPAETVRRLKLQILQERLRLSEAEAGELLAQFKVDAAKQLGIPPSTIEVDFEFAGRELDFTITADMQNLPPSRSRSS